jgi:hypothetical protein
MDQKPVPISADQSQRKEALESRFRDDLIAFQEGPPVKRKANEPARLDFRHSFQV